MRLQPERLPGAAGVVVLVPPGEAHREPARVHTLQPPGHPAALVVDVEQLTHPGVALTAVQPQAVAAPHRRLGGQPEGDPVRPHRQDLGVVGAARVGRHHATGEVRCGPDRSSSRHTGHDGAGGPRHHGPLAHRPAPRSHTCIMPAAPTPPAVAVFARPSRVVAARGDILRWWTCPSTCPSPPCSPRRSPPCPTPMPSPAGSPTSPSGTASGASSCATVTRSSWRAGGPSPSPATSPRWSSPSAATCHRAASSTPRSSCAQASPAHSGWTGRA